MAIGKAWALALALGLGLLGNFTQAASFDCAKASTKVEKLICADTEISKLDEELNAAYKAALQNESQAESIKQAQKQWMMERNSCGNAGCVKQAYETRLLWLSKDGSTTKHENRKNSSVSFSGQWHLKLCDKNISNECGGFTVYLIQTGGKS